MMTALRERERESQEARSTTALEESHLYLFDHDAAKSVSSKQNLALICSLLFWSVLLNSPEESQCFLLDPSRRELMGCHTGHRYRIPNRALIFCHRNLHRLDSNRSRVISFT